jgi:hypothetical protein
VADQPLCGRTGQRILRLARGTAGDEGSDENEKDEAVATSGSMNDRVLLD